ncbi:response regulator transcription factor [Zobellella iuensis]|uniref:Response regulator n=1 Tax=Zobellella iuensis TaxID=2803811 RepID=A0ABS1QPI9_9GAMM|nr:response regulator [Zobellella iuensis]MBL1376199.1 response regulator [Zobellella iuensis]
MTEQRDHVLMVEDDEDIAFLMRFLLERNGYRVTHAANGREAKEWIDTAAPPALVLLDVMLPYRDGLELLQDIRALPAWRHTPVLMLTAKNREADIVRALELGADDYVVKPFQPDELLARIRRMLRKLKR